MQTILRVIVRFTLLVIVVSAMGMPWSKSFSGAAFTVAVEAKIQRFEAKVLAAFPSWWTRRF